MVENLSSEAMSTTSILCDDLHPSQNMNHMFSPIVDHMPDSLCLHVPQIYKKNSISWLVLTPFSACSYTLRFGSYKLDIYDTMVHCHNLMGLALLKPDNFRKWGSYI